MIIKITLLLLMLFLTSCAGDDDDDNSDGDGVLADPSTLSCADLIDYYAECRIALRDTVCALDCLERCYYKPECDDKYYCLAAFCKE